MAQQEKEKSRGSLFASSALLLVLVSVISAILLGSAEAQGTSVLSYDLTQAKIPVSGLTSISPVCRVKGSPASLVLSREKKNGIVSFRPKLGRPCTAVFQFALTEIDPALIQSLELTFRYRGPTTGITLAGPKKTITSNGITFVAQQSFEVIGDGRTFERFNFSFEAVPRETAADPVGASGFEYLFAKANTLELGLSRAASKKKAIMEFDELHLQVSYYVASPMVSVKKVEALLSSFENSIKQGSKSTVVSPQLFSKLDPRIQALWQDNIGTTTIIGGVISAQDNSVMVVGTTTLPTGATASIEQGIVTNCDDSVCSVTAVSKICFTAQNFQTSIIKGYVGQQFASLPSLWFEAFVPDFSQTNCVYFSTGDTEFEGFTLSAGVNLFLNGANPIFNPIFLGQPISITGLIGFDCGDDCIPSQEYAISTPNIGTFISTSAVSLKSLALILHEIILLPNDFGISGLVNLAGQDIAITGSYVFGGEITVTASLPGLCWNNPFNIAPFLKLCDIGGSLVFDPRTPKFFVSAAISAKGYASFSPKSPATATLIVNIDGGVALILNDLPFGNAISEVVSIAQPGVSIPSEVNEILAAVPVIQTLAISTFDTGAPYDVLEGFTLVLPIKVTGGFADTLNSILIDPSSIQFALRLRITPSLFLIALELSDITIYAGMKIVDTSLSLTVQKAAAPSLAIQTGLEVQLSGNPGPLTFIVIGAFQGKSITIAGAMVGDWVNPFGLKGFTLGDVAVEVGFGPPVPPAIVRFGITAKMIIGSKFVRFAGLVDIQQPQQMFLYGEFSGQDGQAFTLKDIIQLALLVANTASGKNMNWDLSGVPLNWGLDNILFKFAPTDAAIGPITFKKGFEVAGGIRILGVILQIGIRTVDLTIPGVPIPIPDFNLNFLLDATEFNSKYLTVIQDAVLVSLPSVLKDNSISSEYLPFLPDWPPNGMSFSQPLFALDYVSIEDFGLFNFFTGAHKPLFKAAVIVYGSRFAVETEVTFAELFGDMKDLILDNLGLPECVTNAECGGRECNHLDGAWKCVDECPPESGKPLSVSAIGCVECLTDLDCQWSGSAGPWCEDKKCMSQSQCDANRCDGATPHCGPVGTCLPGIPDFCDATSSSCGVPGACEDCGGNACVLAVCACSGDSSSCGVPGACQTCSSNEECAAAVCIPEICKGTSSSCGVPGNCKTCSSNEECAAALCIPEICKADSSSCGTPGNCKTCSSSESCVLAACVGVCKGTSSSCGLPGDCQKCGGTFSTCVGLLCT